jgi:WD40 repeat protein
VPVAFAFSPRGRFLVSANGNQSHGGTLSVFAIARNGTLAGVAGPSPPMPFSEGADDLAFTPDGRRLIAFGTIHGSGGAIGSAAVDVYSMDSRGTLRLLRSSPLRIGDAGGMALGTSGRLIAITGRGDGSAGVIWMLSLGRGGSLRQLPGSPFHVRRAGPDTVRFSPNGRFLAVGDNGHGRILLFSVTSAGALKRVAAVHLPISPLTGEAEYSNDLRFNPSGRLLAASVPPRVMMLSVGRHGSLTRVPGSPFSIGRVGNPLDDPDTLSFTPNGRVLAAANRGDSYISLCRVDRRGILKPLAGSPFAQPRRNGDVIGFSRDGRLLVTNGSALWQGLSVFSVRLPS